MVASDTGDTILAHAHGPMGSHPGLQLRGVNREEAKASLAPRAKRKEKIKC